MGKRTEKTLTAAFCRSAKPAELVTPDGTRTGRISYPDLEVKGLELRVSARGEKTWCFRYRNRLNGRQGRVTLGLFDPSFDSAPDEPQEIRTLTLHGARAAARLLRGKVDAGADPAADRRFARMAVKTEPIQTMADLSKAYFEACETGTHRPGRRRRKADSTIKMERWLWGKYLEPRIADEFIEGLTRARLKALLREIFSLAPSQADKCRGLLSQFFNFAVEEERLAANPIARVAKMADQTPRTRTLSADELKMLWSALEGGVALRIPTKTGDQPLLVSPPVRIAIQVAMVTLQRRSEVAGMQVSELDLENKVWIVPAGRMKGREEHLVPLSDLAVRLIKRAFQLNAKSKQGQGLAVFPSRRSKDIPIEGPALSHAMADFANALHLEDATLHDLRRTGATGIAALGVPPYVISKVLAHKDSGGGAAITARHYNLYVYANEKRDALDRWATHLQRLTGPTPDKPRPRKSSPVSRQAEPA